jgi:hypothetical protein
MSYLDTEISTTGIENSFTSQLKLNRLGCKCQKTKFNTYASFMNKENFLSLTTPQFIPQQNHFFPSSASCVEEVCSVLNSFTSGDSCVTNTD